MQSKITYFDKVTILSKMLDGKNRKAILSRMNLHTKKSTKLKPIFHQKLGSRWLPNANEIYTKNMKFTWPTRKFCVGYPLHLYCTDWRPGLASGVTQILGLASGIGVGGNAKIYPHVGISHAKFWRRGHCPTPTPDARYFALQWNIGLNHWKKTKLITYCLYNWEAKS